MTRRFSVALLAIVLASCASRPTGPSDGGARLSLPPFAGWYDGERVYYITTEITDPRMATAGGVTYAPRWRDALPAYPKPPAERTVLERV